MSDFKKLNRNELFYLVTRNLDKVLVELYMDSNINYMIINKNMDWHIERDGRINFYDVETYEWNDDNEDYDYYEDTEFAAILERAEYKLISKDQMMLELEDYL